MGYQTPLPCSAYRKKFGWKFLSPLIGDFSGGSRKIGFWPEFCVVRYYGSPDRGEWIILSYLEGKTLGGFRDYF